MYKKEYLKLYNKQIRYSYKINNRCLDHMKDKGFTQKTSKLGK